MTKENPQVSIIILNYNTGKFLKQCLQSIWKSIEKNKKELKGVRIIVVDNGSTDGSVKYIKPLIKNKKNLGFSAGNNVGVREALKKNPDYILFLNPDTVVSSTAIKTVLSFMQKKPEVGIATCRLELINGQLDEASHRGFPTPWRSFCHFFGLSKIFPQSRIFAGYTLGHLLGSRKPHEIDACTGAFMMVRTRVGKEVNWWDEDYFWYGEDIDFCYRVKRLGWKIFFLPQVKITHYRGVSSGIKKHSQGLSKAKLKTRLKAAKASTEAMRIFYKKHYLNKYPKIISFLVLITIEILQRIRAFKIKLSNCKF